MMVKNNFHIAQNLWYKIGGEVKYFLECTSRKDIEDALNFIKEKNIEKVFVCGTGSNLIFTDDYFNGCVIQISADPNNKDIIINEEGLLEAYAGESLDSLIQFAFERNLIGLEWAGGLPGTVGAAVRGNVGAYGGEIKDTLFAATVLDYSSGVPQIRRMTRDALAFVYRGSLIKDNKKMIVISAEFNLKEDQESEIIVAREVYKKNIQLRQEKHPLEFPNCGSVFKNLRDPEQIARVLAVYPELKDDVAQKWHGKMAVASVIEKLGLKGFRIGDAQVSEKHALFIVNLGHAKAKDVLAIIDTVQKKFQEKFGFQLETEVEIVK